ncbi:hypothetical protein HYFRA_00013962 [Hymenoscyphus fraxineus]|uniref:Uncharacterized protein n=1 Tax=Hymenoscyphus fraxineus TaxID=746836 RepID=A0A9N9L8Q8_9HELO|nr:hypothetical protein HYFRA_00013962 [Hymenoscyphus fraxineus]
MQFLTKTAIIFTSSTFLRPFATASPVTTKVNVTTIDQSSSKLYFEQVETNLMVDEILSHLQSNDKINWPASGHGHFVDITEKLWLGAISDISTTNFRRDGMAFKNLESRTSTSTIGNIGAYSAKAACYGSGAVMDDTSIAGSVIAACDGLIGANVPPLVVNALRVWQTGGIPDSNGIASYIRFSAKLFQKDFQYDQTLCTEAMGSFNSYCQKASGKTQGGEIRVGGAVSFNADPTSLNCNC